MLFSTYVSDTNYGHPMRVFFQMSQIFWPIGNIVRISCEVFLGYFREYDLLKFCHCVSLIRDFALLSHFFSKKIFSYILLVFLFGIGTWIWAVDNLRSKNHGSVVLDYSDSEFFVRFPIVRAYYLKILGTKILEISKPLRA